MLDTAVSSFWRIQKGNEKGQKSFAARSEFVGMTFLVQEIRPRFWSITAAGRTIHFCAIMPGIINPTTTCTLTSPYEMSPAESYERLQQFLDTYDTTQRFTVDDNNHDMGLLCAHLPSGEIRATTARLNREQISNFMRSHGFQCWQVGGESTAIECTRPPTSS